MVNERIKEAKIVLLALAEQLQDVSPESLKEMALANLYFDYFTVSEAFSELEALKLVHVAERKNEKEHDAKGRAIKRVALTPQGQSVLDTLLPSLPSPLQLKLDGLHPPRLERELSLLPDANGAYQLRIQEGHQGALLFSLELQLPTEALGQRILDRFQEDPALFYQGLLQQVLGEDLP